MDVAAFVHDLLRYATLHDCFQRIGLQVEGPVVQGHGYVDEDAFVRFYFNQRTQTIAFALVRKGERIWGVDRDNVRGWHLHPAGSPTTHVAIEAQSVKDIIERLRVVLDDLAAVG